MLQRSNVAALEHARQAAALEPNNVSYRSLLRQFESGGSWYEQRQYRHIIYNYKYNKTLLKTRKFSVGRLFKNTAH
mgnify:CR=1 FL=1